MRQAAALFLALAAIGTSQLAANAADDPHEACFRAATNAERANAGVATLEDDAKMDAIARAHSDQMAARGTIYHNPELQQQAGSYEYLGENVGMGSSCLAIHEAFMDSPGHRANILDEDYTKLGVGVTVRDDDLYATLIFWTPPDEPPAKPKPKPRPKQTSSGCP